MFVAALAASLPAHANGRIGWVWANEPTTASYTPDAAHSYNSKSGAITITRLATGIYEVVMDGLYRGTEASNVQVNAYGANGNYCNAGVWGHDGGSKVQVTVACFNSSGALADSQFTAMYQSHSGNTGTATKGLAFVTTNPDTFPPPYSYNSTGGTNTVAHNGTGSYTVALPGLSESAGDVQVTAFAGYGQRCKVDNWNAISGTTYVNVQCYDNTGAPADVYFSLAYSLADPYAVTTPPTNYLAYAKANRPNDPNSYTPAVQFNYNNFKVGHLTVQKTSRGNYTVTIPGTLPPFSTSNVLVTAYGNDSGYCNVVSWATSTINVACFAQGGVPANGQFDVSFQAWE